MMNNIKPCPFCKSEAHVKHDHRWPDDAYNAIDAYEVVCLNFDCIIYDADDVWYKTEAEAIEAWNTRADDNEEVITCLNCGAQIDMLGMFTPLAKSSVLYRHYATYCPACGERLVD